MIARLARTGHRVLGGITAGLLIALAFLPSPVWQAEALRLALLALPAVVLLAIATLWRRTLPPAWVLLHLNLMLLGVLCALAAVRLSLPAAAIAASLMLASGIGAGWMAGRSRGVVSSG